MSNLHPITISSWTLGDQCSFEERVQAAKKAGYEGIGLRAETYADALNEGLTDSDILAILEKYDMKVTEVEYIVQWAEEHRSYEQKYKEQICFHMCQLFGVRHMWSDGKLSGGADSSEVKRALSESRGIYDRSRADAVQRNPGSEKGVSGGDGLRLRKCDDHSGQLALGKSRSAL